MNKQFIQTLSEFESLVEDRGGFRRLDILIADIKETGRINREDLAEIMSEIVEKAGERAPDFWLGCRTVIEELHLGSRRLIDSLEIRLSDARLSHDPDIQYEVAKSFALAGGDLTPKVLNGLVELRSKRSPLWVDLAIRYAYAGEPVGLTEVLGAISASNETNWKWTDLKTRYRLLAETVGATRLTALIAAVYDAIPDGSERNQFKSWLKERTGRTVSTEHSTRHRPSPPASALIDEDVATFLSSNSKRAARMRQPEERVAA
jgi:hypothetical protein